MAALLSHCVWVLAEWDGILWSLAGGAVVFVLVRWVPPDLRLQAIVERFQPLRGSDLIVLLIVPDQGGDRSSGATIAGQI